MRDVTVNVNVTDNSESAGGYTYAHSYATMQDVKDIAVWTAIGTVVIVVVIGGASLLKSLQAAWPTILQYGIEVVHMGARVCAVSLAIYAVVRVWQYVIAEQRHRHSTTRQSSPKSSLMESHAVQRRQYVIAQAARTVHVLPVQQDNDEFVIEAKEYRNIGR